ncbi:hyalin-like [Diadema setosum]|uniref:hyalin-like n=1 Tax=Diadema setosum TaxID=31175 RepID=UPI003B3B0B71
MTDPSPCLQNPCQNQGVCQEISGLCSAYQCVCPAGFGGVNCEIVILENGNPCNSFPCANGGECLTLDSQFYTCLCRDGYAGVNCQQMTAAVPGFDSCNANPCQNGATCYNSYHSNDPTPTSYTPQYYCMCAQGFTGANCQLPTANAPALDICQATNPNRPDCQNGGTCHNSYESITGDVDYVCDCLPTFIGHNCETIMPDPCTSDPCENNGICTSFDTYYTCQCQTGFSGDRCQTVTDFTPPTVLNCPDDVTVNVQFGQTQALVTWIEPTSPDGVLTYRSNVPNTLFNVGTTLVTYVFEDTAQNWATCTFNVIVNGEGVDDTPPTITGCPSDITRNLPTGSTSLSVTWTPPQAFDADAGGTVTLESNLSPGDLFTTGTTPVVYVATNEAGLTTTCTFDVIVTSTFDTVPPVINGCPDDIFETLPNGSQSLSITWTPPVATDNSGVVNLESNFNPGAQFPPGQTSVVYTATDNSGLETTCTFSVFVATSGDVTPPVITGCPGTQTATLPSGSSVVAVTWTPPQATDASPPVTLTVDRAPGSFFPAGTTMVTYTATDAVGLQSVCTFNVLVVTDGGDTVPPVINNCPSDRTAILPLGTNAVTVSWTVPTATDNSGQVTLIPNIFPGSPFTLGTTEVIYTATDGAGLQTTCSFTVTVSTTAVTDVTPPTFVNCPMTQVITVAAGVTSSIATWQVPTATDTQGQASVAATSGHSPGDAFPLGTIAVVYTATDQAGLQETCVFNIIVTTSDTGPVEDRMAPIILSCPSVVRTADPNSQFTFVSWDLPTADDNGVVVTPSVGLTQGFFPLGVTGPFTYTFTDANNNAATCTLYVFLIDPNNQDTTPPTLLTCPSDVTVTAAAGASSATATWAVPTASDNSGGDLIFTSTYDPGDSFGIGTTPVSYSILDEQGNAVECNFNVVVVGSGTTPVDQNPPTINGCPSSFTVTVPAGSNVATATWTVPTAVDAEGTATVTGDSTPPVTLTAGQVLVVTYTATDTSGLQSLCTFNIIAQGTTTNQPPQLVNCPNDISVTLPVSSTTISVPWTAPTATDDSGITPTITTTRQPGSLFGVGTTPVTYTATDNLGLSSTCSFNVIVTASTTNQPPQLVNCPTDISVTLPVSSTTISVPWTAPTATDDSGIMPTVTGSRQPGSLFGEGTTSVTYTATDNQGASSSCTFNVIVTDQIPLNITCPDNVVVNLPSGVTSGVVSWNSPTVDDAQATITSTTQSGSVLNLGRYAVAYTAVDMSGNSDQCTFYVTVTNSAGQEILALNNCPVENTPVSYGYFPSSSCNPYTEPTLQNTALGTLTSQSHTPQSDFSTPGNYFITYTFTSNAGITTQCAFILAVQENVDEKDLRDFGVFCCVRALLAQE